MMDGMTNQAGYDWVDDDDLSLAETMRRFEALDPQPVDVPTDLHTDNGAFLVTVNASTFISVAVPGETWLYEGEQHTSGALSRPVAVSPAVA